MALRLSHDFNLSPKASELPDELSNVVRMGVLEDGNITLPITCRAPTAVRCT